MKIRNLLVSTMTLVLTSVIGVAHAQGSVVGQIRAETSVVINPGPAQQLTGSQEFPFLEGDIASTKGKKSARIVLSSGNSVITLAPDAVASVVTVDPLTIAISEGGVSFEAVAGLPVTLISPHGTFSVISDDGAVALAVVEEGKFAVVSQQGDMLIQGDSSNSVVTLNDGKAFLVGGNAESKIVDVAVGSGPSGSGFCAPPLWLTLCVIVGVGGVYELTKDDNTPTSP